MSAQSKMGVAWQLRATVLISIAALICFQLAVGCWTRQDSASSLLQVVDQLQSESPKTRSPIVDDDTTPKNGIANVTTNANNTSNILGREHVNSTNHTHPTFGPFCIVHVGKTAGGTISCRLGGKRMAKNCPLATGITRRSRFMRMAKGKLHKNRDWGCLRKNQRSSSIIDTWLFTTRNPLDRIASWFQYEHWNMTNVDEMDGNRPALFRDCYASLDDLAQIGLRIAFDYDYGYNGTIADTAVSDPRYSLVCAKRAYQAIVGAVGYQYHNLYNYGYYRRWMEHAMRSSHNIDPNTSTISPPTILVIRSEHLQQDWAHLESLFDGKQANASLSTPRSANDADYFNVVRQHQSNSAVSSESFPYLCRALCEELRTYLWLIRTSANLDAKDAHASCEELRSKCPEIVKANGDVMCGPSPKILNVEDPAPIIPVPSFPT
mmetsp:Transcript_17922/g.49710  ORF Transcript_17922/g.49710 Transcript_17922/m.49710 type:complete len:435 (+) Transcript_17922:201-1505(+)